MEMTGHDVGLDGVREEERRTKGDPEVWAP